MSRVVITCAMTADRLIQDPAPRPHGWLGMAGDSEQALVDELRFSVNPTIQGGVR